MSLNDGAKEVENGEKSTWWRPCSKYVFRHFPLLI